MSTVMHDDCARPCAVGALLIAALVACRSPAVDDEARALARLDPAEASQRVRSWVTSCEGFARTLERLAQSRISGRLLAGLVDDAVERAREHCARPAATVRGSAGAAQLARSRLADDRPAEAIAVLAGATDEPAIRYRRAELLDRQGRSREALVELERALARAPDDAGRTSRRALQISLAVTAGRHADVARAIADAPLTERRALAYRATTDAPPDALEGLVAAATEPELAMAVGDRLERDRGPVAALDARARAARAAPEDAEVHDALGRALAAARRMDEALAAWDRAAAIAPAQPSYRLAPIRALVHLGDPDRARLRAGAIAEAARASGEVDQLVTAAAAAAASTDLGGAVALAREARARRPTDGRLAFLLADRLAEAGDRATAAETYAELLVCGAHGRAWHRHEVAGKLVALATDAASRQLVATALDAPRACAAVEPDELARLRTTAHDNLARLQR